MRKRVLMFALVSGFVLGYLLFDPPAPRSAGASSNGPPTKKTGAPGEGTCFDCHGLNLNDGVGSVSITVAGLPAGGYVPGQQYDVTVGVGRTGSLRWGFEFTTLKNSDNTAAGTSAAGTDNRTGTVTAVVNSSTRTYVRQITNLGADGTYATNAGPVSWTFKWTAPIAGTGAVTMYVCGLAADNDGGTSDTDYPYTITKVIQEGVSTAVRETTWGIIKNTYR